MPTSSVLDWLLADGSPPIQYLARTRLLNESPQSRRSRALRRACNSYPPTAGMLERVADAIAAGDYAKYRGAFWTLIFLADLHADADDPRLAPLADHVLSRQLPNGGFSPNGAPRFEIVCLTANVLRALVHFRRGDDPRVIRGFRRLAERILEHAGVPCVALQYSLHTACKMTLPQTLRCLAVAPQGTPLQDVGRVRELLTRQMLAVRVYQYMRPDVRAYHRALQQRRKGTTERALRLRWINDHPVEDADLVAKPGWMRFGFPRSYNPDLLEGLLALVENDAPPDAALCDALDQVERRRLPDGRWKLDDSLNGKLLCDIEQKGRPSKWVTLRALQVLKHFGRLRT